MKRYAKKRRTHAEKGFQIFEDLAQEGKERDLAEEGSRTKDLNQVDVAIVVEKASQHRFVAQAWNQARYGNKAGQTEVTISLATCTGRFAKNENCSGHDESDRE